MAETTATATLTERAARQLSNTTKTPPQWVGASPRWLTQMLPWTPTEAGVYRVNRDLDDKFALACTPDPDEDLPRGVSRYSEQPREYLLSSISSTVEVPTRLSDLFRSPMDQVKEQLTLAVEKLKEEQEDQLVNNAGYGLLHNA